MESIELFIKLYKKPWEDKKLDIASEVLRQLPDYLKNTPKDYADQALGLLLYGPNGLLKCIKKILDSPKILNSSDVFLRTSFETLQCLIVYSKQYYEPYIKETCELCFYCLKTRCWLHARKSAAITYRKLMEMFTHYDINVDELINHFVDSYLTLYCKKDGCVFYIILGAIGKLYPKLEIVNQYINKIFIQLLKDFINQHSASSSTQPEEIKIYLECYLDLFVNFIPFEDQQSKRESYFRQLYKMISKLCENGKAQQTYRNKAIELLTTYAKHFEDEIYQDATIWYTLFNNILGNVETNLILNAMRNFHRILAIRLLKEDDKYVFESFTYDKLRKLQSFKDLTSTHIQSILNGLGEFAVVNSKYAPDDIQEIFQAVAVRALHTSEEMNDNLEITAACLQTLSQILRYSTNTTFHQVTVLKELCVRFIRGFPELRGYSQNRAMRALNETFVNLQQELESVPNTAISYKNFLPLWHSLFKTENQEKSANLTCEMFQDFVLVLITYVSKLNLNVVPDNEELFSNTLLALKAENETDFWFFINLVDLYVEVFERVDSHLLQLSVEKLATFFINYSYKQPLISGFYKIIKVILKCCDDVLDYQQYFSKVSQELVTLFFTDLLKQISGFSEELQFSCISLIFNTPLFIIKSLIDEMLPIFEIAFNVGLSNLTLAYSALKTLDDWIKNPEIQLSKNFLKEILCYMEPYLTTNENTSKAILSNTNIENTQGFGVNDFGMSLEDLQRRMLLFHGSLDSAILFEFVHEKSTNTNASWTKKDILQCELLFPDIRLEIRMDKLLPRIIELTNSGDGIIKTSACELFHSMITIILGKKLTDQFFNKDVFTTVLRLGCDPEDAVKNLFHPLSIQLAHYLSSGVMKESKVPQIYIDSLFGGLSEEFNTTMRDHCGLYLKEFTKWSIKQSLDNDPTKDPNVLGVIRRINTLALYPSNKKRLAAVTAFNSLYTILRENLSIVQTYWLELLYGFVKCLEEYDNVHVFGAIDHVEKVIKHHKNIFNAKNHNRRKPPGFVDETLASTLLWLFDHCDSLNAKCRNKCMMLFENLLCFVNHPDAVKQKLEEKAGKIALKSVESRFDDIDVNNARAFLQCLDFHIWIMQKNFVSSMCLFKFNDDNVDMFANYFATFVRLMVDRDWLNFNVLENEELANLMNEIILKILEFVSTVLETSENRKILPWNKNLYLLIVRCLLNPQKIGLTAKNLQALDQYFTHLEKIMVLMTNKISEEALKKCFEVFMEEADEHFNQFTEIQNIVETIDKNEKIYDLELFVKGLFAVKKCKFFDFEKEKNYTNEYWQPKLEEIFKSLKIRMMNNNVCKILNDYVKNYFNALMALYFEPYQSEIVIRLINLIATNDPLETSTGIRIPHGQYFLDTFRQPILSSMLKDIAETMKILDEFHTQFPYVVLCLIEELLLFAQLNKAIDSDVLAKEVLLRCGALKRLVNNIEDREARFFRINQVAVKLTKKPTDIIENKELYKDINSWLMSQMIQANDYEKKIILLQNFSACLVDETSDSDNILLPINLKGMNNEDWLNNVENDVATRFQASAIFQALLKCLLSTKSLLMYKRIVHYGAGVCKLIHEENLKKYFEPYFASISDDCALNSVEMCYKIFMDLSIGKQRIDVLKHFLLPSLQSTNKTVIEKFYNKFGQEMVEHIKQNLFSPMLENEDKQRLIVTKLGCYSIFEVFYSHFDINFADVKDRASGVEKSLSSTLVEEIVKNRLQPPNYREDEMARQMHCAALNCCIAVVSQKNEETFYKFIFMEDRATDKLLWERIVGQVQYTLLPPTSSASIRRDSRKLINIRCNQHEEFAVSYANRRDISQLSFVEDINAYDLNNAVISSSPCQKPSSTEVDRRLSIRFEVDQLNEHECMPMVTGVLLHMYNTGIATLPEPGQTNAEMPLFLKHFRNGFSSENPNVLIFLLKIITNVKQIFLPYIKPMFIAISNGLKIYLAGFQNIMNHVVRDILLIILESKYVPSTRAEKNAAIAMLEQLFLKAFNEFTNIQDYNFEIIERLCTLWSGILKNWPNRVMPQLMRDRPPLALYLMRIFVRTNTFDALVAIQQNPHVRRFIEVKTMAYLMGHRDPNTVNITVPDIEVGMEMLGVFLRTSEFFGDNEMKIMGNLGSLTFKVSHELSSRVAHALYTGWQSETEGCISYIVKYASPSNFINTNHSIACRCLDLYKLRLANRQFDRNDLIAELDTYVPLMTVLNEHILACLEPTLQILIGLLDLIPEHYISKHLERVANEYCSPMLCTVEHRLLAYKCLCKAYLKYNDSSTSAGIWLAQLIRGFADPSQEVHDLLNNFWENESQLPNTCYDRLRKLLTIYPTESKEGYGCFLCLLMLNLTAKSSDADKPMFRPLIEQCSFREWNPTAGSNSNKRSQQLGSMVPLFAPSLLQATQRLKHQIQVSGTELSSSFLGSLRIRATSELVFEPTLPDTSSNGRSRTRIPDPFENQLSKRMIGSSAKSFVVKPGAEHEVPTQKKESMHDKLKKEIESRCKSSKLYRKYRIGDFPDVEMSNSSFVTCLRQLAMRDWQFSKDLAVVLVCCPFDREKDTHHTSNILNGMVWTISKIVETYEHNCDFAPAALEITQHVYTMKLNYECIGRTCKNMKLDALGIVLLEDHTNRQNNTVYGQEEEPPYKRIKFICKKINWIEIASMYKSIGYIDVVSSIFQEADTFSKHIKPGALAQIAGDWMNACESYKKAYEVTFDVEQDFCLDSMFECLRELSDWGAMNKIIEKTLHDDYNDIWNHEKKHLLLPWIFEGQLQKALTDYVSDKELEVKNKAFVQNVIDWIHSGNVYDIKSNFGQELSVMLLCSLQKSEETARFTLNTNLNRVREQWIRLSPMAVNSRLGLLTKLRGIHNIETYINTIKAEDIEETTKGLIRYWDSHVPSLNDDLASWNMHVTYRLSFTKLLHEKLKSCSEDTSLMNELLMASARQRIRICELAMQNKNNVVAKKHSARTEELIRNLGEIEELAENAEYIKLQNDFMLTASKYKFVCAENESNANKKCNYYVSSWKIAKNILENESASATVKINVKHHLFDLTTSIRRSAKDNEELSNKLMADEFVMANVEPFQREAFVDKLMKYSYDNLKNVCNMGSTKEMSESFTKFGKYCYSLIHDKHYNVSTNLIGEFISSILTGMSLGSLEAAHYFPCLLKYEYYENYEEMKQLFISKSAEVPSWLFLFWQAQIVVHLNKPLGQLLIPIMQGLVNDYPNGVMYDFRQMYTSLSQELQADANIRKMYDRLFANSKLESFIEAMHHVCQPEHYLSYHLSLLKDSNENFNTAIESLIEKVYNNQNLEQDSVRGPLYNMAIEKYKAKVEELKNLDPESVKRHIDKLNEELYVSMRRRIAEGRYQALQLKHYSPYLSYFTEKDLEIELPGQYTKREKPLPRYHTKISKFDRYVRVMDSKRNPIKINVIGNDAKIYGFLVKFGEDLKQDQRLQQIFNIANETFSSDKNCSQRNMSINTYNVVPFSTSLGLIEWVDGTKSLKEFVEFSMSDKSVINSVAKKYQEWIDIASKQGKNSYKEALLKYDRKTVTDKMQELTYEFDWDCLRKTFMTISPNVECFVSLRHKFITNYATMCVVHWITGVGDRHLENILIEVKSGKCYGIDFGAAFGAGIDQAVPELVPFRLTPQIVGLIKPLNEQAVLGVMMTHVLKALRNKRGPILACFDVFIHEPLDWSKNKKGNSEEINNSDIKWSAEKKIEIVESKLNGINPAEIMIEELSNMHGGDSSDKYFARYIDVVKGINQNPKSFRSTLFDKKLTPEEQVKCLLEQATDLNVLGRMYVGWCPFV